MKKIFLTGIAVMVAAVFSLLPLANQSKFLPIGTQIAEAADVSFSGQLRTRYEWNGRANATTVGGNNQEADDLTDNRVRINLKTTINPDTSAFIQMQSVHRWGGGNDADTANDADASVGLHQAYFTLNNFAGLPVKAKVGRQQIVLDGHRLFGHTGWTSGAQTHDALRLSHSGGNHTMNYGVTNVTENADTNTENDVFTHFIHNNFQGVLGGSLSTIIVMQDDDCGILAGGCTGATNRWFTIGARQAGKLYGLDYRAEYYYQTGGAGGAGNAIAPQNVASVDSTAHNRAGFESEASRNAYMFGVRVGKSFKNVAWKPKITLWYDYLSGTNDEDMNEGTWGTFDTLYDTGHKFYGFMDLFLNGQGTATDYLGLQDIAVKLVLKPRAKWTLKADVHNFHVAEGPAGSPDIATIRGIHDAATSNATGLISAGGRAHGSELGTELDLTLVHKYNSNVKFVFGYSNFMTETLWHAVTGNAGGNRNSLDWAYVMADVKF